MNARDTIQLVVEGKPPKGWSTTGGVYGNHSNWPYDSTYYAKCPKCGLVHGSYKTMREAHSKKLCPNCNVEAINKIKDEVVKVTTEPDYDPKEMSKIVGEAIDDEPFDPFDTPPESEGVPVPPLDAEDVDKPSASEVERILMGNWVDYTLRHLAHEENYDLDDLSIDKAWSEEHGNFDPDNLEDTQAFKVEAGSNEAWLVFRSEDLAEAYAVECVISDMQSEPELFNQSFVKDYIDDDKLRQAVGDTNENWEEDIRSLDYEEMLEKLVDGGYVESDDPIFFDEDGQSHPVDNERINAINVYMEQYIEREKPEPQDPWDFLRDIYGEEDAVKEAIKMVGFDVDKAAQGAVSADGWPHFVARYDGHSHTLDNDAVYCRTD